MFFKRYKITHKSNLYVEIILIFKSNLSLVSVDTINREKRFAINVKDRLLNEFFFLLFFVKIYSLKLKKNVL